MTFNLPQLFVVGFTYLLILFGTAYATEKGLISSKLVKHPLIYTLSLGVYASAWAIYGVVGFGYQSGYNFLAYFFGISAAFFLAPILLKPILRLAKNYRLGSLADLAAYRYRSQSAGTLVCIVMLFGTLPLLALQIQAVSESVHILTGDNNTQIFGFAFVMLILIFTMLFGARNVATKETHNGLVIAIAFETVVKITAMLLIAAYVLYSIFGSYEALDQWLSQHPQSLNILYKPIEEGPWRTLILPFFVSAITMPHMYHMIFAESPSEKALKTANWGFPLIMLLMAITIPIILWGSIKTGVNTDPEYFTLGLGMANNSFILSMVAFIAGLSAASGVMIVVTLAMAIMLINHVVLPIYQPPVQQNIYHWVLWVRRVLIATILIIAYGFYFLLGGTQDLSELGLIAFTATVQFVPGLIGVIFWPGATKWGFISGLSTGFITWLIALLFPIISSTQYLSTSLFDIGYVPTIDNWQVPALTATFLNTVVFTLVSLVTKQSAAEKAAAQTCTLNNLNRPHRFELSVNSTAEFTRQLSTLIGYETAKREVGVALRDLAMDSKETRPYALRRLRDQIEANLSSLMGPAVAKDIVDEGLPYKKEPGLASKDDIHFMESRLEEYQDKLTGLAAELDSLRRFHRQVLNDLPMGVCSLATTNEILSWNREMENITGIKADEVVGSGLWHLYPPWLDLLSDIARTTESHTFLQRELRLRGGSHWFNIHKAAVNVEPEKDLIGGIVVVIEEVTQNKVLEQQVAHNERLAAIGKLAAGVAHEIGNPITGIACLAQDISADVRAQDIHPPMIDQMAAQILEQTKRVSNIVQSLVNFSHSGHLEKPDLRTLKLRPLIQQSLDLIKLNHDKHHVHYINQCPDELSVVGNEQKLIQVFINLFNNARDASEPESSVIISAQINEQLDASGRPGPDHGAARITITDKGHGIPDKIKDKIFDPFVTTKDPGKGTGLGLSLVYRFISDQNGKIEINSPPEGSPQGTEVRLILQRF